GEVLPARIAWYAPQALDALCNSGRFIWLRANGGTGKTGSGPLKTTPIVLLQRTNSIHWQTDPPQTGQLSANAATIHHSLQQTGLLRTQVEQALAELVARGLVHSDGFAGLRALLTPASKRAGFSHKRRRHGLAATGSEFDRAGRWSLIRYHKTETGQEQPGWL